MSSSEEYYEYILDCLSDIEGISGRPMMGEYLLYCRNKVIGGVYDNRFLVKQFKSSDILMPDAPLVTPYEGAKKMILVENAEDREFTARLVNSLYDELPEPKPKKKKK